MSRVSLLMLLIVLLAGGHAARGQGLDEVRAKYTKYEYRVPMRDGAQLFTAIYIPKDRSRTYPILMTRTPYSAGPYGAAQSRADLGPSGLFGRAGYIFVYQDVRGRFLSEGTFANMRPHNPRKLKPADVDESSDTYDTVEWLVKYVPNHNGNVGLYGISYPGFYTSAGIIDAHPAIKAASPQAPIADWFVGDDWHHNGALFLAHTFNFMANFGRDRPTPTTQKTLPFEHGTLDGYKFFLELGPLSRANELHFRGRISFWNELLEHETYDDFWKARNIRPHLARVPPTVAVLTVGGWFDAENLFGALETYKALEAAPGQRTNTLVMGPWTHGGWRGDGDAVGPVRFDAKTAIYFREHVELPFFERHLKQQEAAQQPEALVFETGANQWRAFHEWPPKMAQPRSLYLSAGNSLRWAAPEESIENGVDQFTSDPHKPVPFVESIQIGMVREYMTADQRFASRRPDVLTYQSAPTDGPITIAGPIRVKLTVSTSGTDADWVVKLIDVHPDGQPDPQALATAPRMDGYQQLVRGDVLRGRFRKSLSEPVAFEPNQPTSIEFEMPDVLHTFLAGHRVMVQVQSTWFPLVDRNPQTFVRFSEAKPADFRTALHRVFRSKTASSRIEVFVLPGL